MTATAAPFGARPVMHSTGFDRATRRTIASAYGSAIFKGAPVVLATDGTLNIGVAGANDFLGFFAGVEYVDVTGKPTYSPFWPAGQVVMANTQVIAYVWEDFDTVFEMQGTGSFVATAIGDQANFVNPGTGSTMTGQSTCALGPVVGAGVQGQLRIIDIAPYVDNAWGDAFTIVRVKNARSQFIANKVAI